MIFSWIQGSLLLERCKISGASSFARLGAEQSGRKEATRCSPQSYDCFTEGFDTVDLKEAKELLAKLETTYVSKEEAKRASVRHWWNMANVKEKIERAAAFLQAVQALLSA